MLARMGNLTLTHERIDDIPLLISLGQTLGLDKAVDAHLGTHGLQQGLTNGELLIVWQAYILSEGDHRKSGVEAWAWKHRRTLEQLLGRPLRRVDFSDDRLGNLLRRFSDTEKWEALESNMWRAQAHVYALEVERVHLDSTTTYGYHTVSEAGVMQYGYSKDHRPDLPQLKLMAALAEPAGQCLAVDLYAGQTADEGLYVPLYQRVRSILGKTGLLYVGDCKMAVLMTRAHIARAGDYYLTRMPRNLCGAEQWQAWVAQREASDSVTLFWEDAEVRGAGCEWEHTLTAEIDGQAIAWVERLQWIYSPAVAAQQEQALAARLQRATAALQALTPEPGRGKRPIREEEVLQARIAVLLQQHQVEGLLQPQWERVEKRETRYLERGRGSATRPTREVLKVHYRITSVERQALAIAESRQNFGWQLQVTNAPAAALPLPQATATYHAGWHLEHDFHKLKERPIGLSPLFVWRDEQILGLTRLLLLALRLLTLIETQVARGLLADDQSLIGLYEGQPHRATQRPTAARLLKAIGRAEVTLTEVQSPDHCEWYLTELPSWLPQVLGYLKLPLDLYERLTVNSILSF
jgi:transposase